MTTRLFDVSDLVALLIASESAKAARMLPDSLAKTRTETKRKAAKTIGRMNGLLVDTTTRLPRPCHGTVRTVSRPNACASAAKALTVLPLLHDSWLRLRRLQAQVGLRLAHEGISLRVRQ